MSKSVPMEFPVAFERILAFARYRRFLPIMIVASVLTFFLFVKAGIHPAGDGANPTTTRSRSDNWWKKQDNIGDIQNTTLGFQKLIVLGLPDRHDKKDVWALAAAASNLEVEWVDGVRGETIPDKAMPAGWNPVQSKSTLGCYRGHMNAMRKIVEERISSALVFEDDADWDVMIRAQLTEFARGTRFLQNVQNPATLDSPYGDDWDFLPIGHCGARSRPEEDSKYWVVHDDPTVTPDSKSEFVISGNYRTPDRSAQELQGNFSRIIYELRDMRCMYAYAVSLRGAERFLYYASVETGAASSDSALSSLCTFRRLDARCYAPFPSLVDSYRPAGPDSKGSDRVVFRGDFREHGETANVVFPVKARLGDYIAGRKSYTSQWPEDTLLPAIDPNKDLLPAGGGFFLTKDKFVGYT